MKETQFGKEITGALVLEFEFMYMYNPVASVQLDSSGHILCDWFDRTLCISNPLPLGTTTDLLSHFFETRCFSRTRANADELLEMLGLKQYSPLGIVKKTHGVIDEDFYWIRFKGEEIGWDDVRVR